MTESTPTADFSDLIADAEAYCDRIGIKLATLGNYALGNTRWFDDRRAGKPCLTTSVERVRRYMAENPQGKGSRAPEQGTAA